MSNGQILVIEDDTDISNMIRIYLTSQGFDVSVAPNGSDGLEKALAESPSLILLDIMLPDMDGYAVCRKLRSTERTNQIPVIFLTQKDTRSDQIAGFEAGADDYITKPFDIVELKLRVKNAIARFERENLTDPRTGLPFGQAIEDQLRNLVHTDNWAIMDCRINHFEHFKETYGFLAGDDVLRFTTILIEEVLVEFGTEDDFVGHVGGDHYLIITRADPASVIFDQLVSRFNEEVLAHYSVTDTERGYILIQLEDGSQADVPLMKIVIGLVNSADQQFADYREIPKLAAEARRRFAANSNP